jgi:hypothetical protein
VIEMVSDLVTREVRLELAVTGGEIQTDGTNDLVKIAAIDRANVPGKCFTGLIKGFGMRSGAMACSAAWDTSCVIVVGADETDMALCVNRIRDLQGGAVVCDAGRVAAELAMPVFGLISELPLGELVAALDRNQPGGGGARCLLSRSAADAEHPDWRGHSLSSNLRRGAGQLQGWQNDGFVGSRHLRSVFFKVIKRHCVLLGPYRAKKGIDHVED